MSATVTLPTTETQEYPTARHAIVKDGHLVILDGYNSSARTLAIYSPSRWASVDVKHEARG